MSNITEPEYYSTDQSSDAGSEIESVPSRLSVNSPSGESIATGSGKLSSTLRRSSFSSKSFMTFATKAESSIADPFKRLEEVFYAESMERKLWSKHGLRLFGMKKLNIGRLVLRFKDRSEKLYLTNLLKSQTSCIILMNLLAMILLIPEFFLEELQLYYLITKGTLYLVLWAALFVTTLVYLGIGLCRRLTYTKCPFTASVFLFIFQYLLGLYLAALNNLGWSKQRLSIRIIIFFAIFLIQRNSFIGLCVMMPVLCLARFLSIPLNIFLFEVPPQVLVVDLFLFISVTIVICSLRYIVEKQERTNYLFTEQVKKDLDRMYEWKARNNQLACNILPIVFHTDIHRFLQKKSSVVHSYDDICFMSIRIVFLKEAKPSVITEIMTTFFSVIEENSTTYNVQQLNPPEANSYSAFHSKAKDCCFMARDCIEATCGLARAHDWEGLVDLKVGIAQNSCVIACIGKKKVFCNGFGKAPWEAQLLSEYAENGEILVNFRVSQVAQRHFKVSPPINMVTRLRGAGSSSGSFILSSSALPRCHSAYTKDRNRLLSSSSEDEDMDDTRSVGSLKRKASSFKNRSLQSIMSNSAYNLSKRMSELVGYKLEGVASGTLSRVFSNLSEVHRSSNDLNSGRNGKKKKKRKNKKSKKKRKRGRFSRSGSSVLTTSHISMFEDDRYESNPSLFRGVDSSKSIFGIDRYKGVSDFSNPGCVEKCKFRSMACCMNSFSCCSPFMLYQMESSRQVGVYYNCNYGRSIYRWMCFASEISVLAILFAISSFGTTKGLFASYFPELLGLWISILFIIFCGLGVFGPLTCILCCCLRNVTSKLKPVSEPTDDADSTNCISSTIFSGSLQKVFLHPLSICGRIFICRFWIEVLCVVLWFAILFSLGSSSFTGFCYFMEVLLATTFFSFGFSSCCYSPPCLLSFLLTMHCFHVVMVEVVFKRYQYGEAIVTLFLIIFVFTEGYRYHYHLYDNYAAHRTTLSIVQEIQKETGIHSILLLNMYPERIVKKMGRNQSKDFMEQVHQGSLLEVKFEGFRDLFDILSAQPVSNSSPFPTDGNLPILRKKKTSTYSLQIVRILNDLFEKFDDAIDEYENIDKIKSFDERYLCFSMEVKKIENLLSKKHKKKKKKKKKKRKSGIGSRTESEDEESEDNPRKKHRRDSSGWGVDNGVHKMFSCAHDMMEATTELLEKRKSVIFKNILKIEKRRRKRERDSLGNIEPLHFVGGSSSQKTLDLDSDGSNEENEEETEGEDKGEDVFGGGSSLPTKFEIRTVESVDGSNDTEADEDEDKSIMRKAETLWNRMYLRVGIHSGTFVTGIIGTQKRLYDVLSPESRSVLKLLCDSCRRGMASMSYEAFKSLQSNLDEKTLDNIKEDVAVVDDMPFLKQPIRIIQVPVSEDSGDDDYVKK